MGRVVFQCIRSVFFDFYHDYSCIEILETIKISKVSGLQLVKPRFYWKACDKLIEIKQFKADCRILFDGPLSDLKDK